MSEPFVGKTVKVVGTSKVELNGSTGVALDYDRDKGRYTVQLENGGRVALKPVNLELAPAATPSAGAGKPTASASSSTASSPSTGANSWQNVGLVVLGALFLMNLMQGDSSGGSGAPSLWGSEDVEYDDRDEASHDGYLSGQVREVVTLDQFRGALAHHADNTGLPVIVDFFSHSCGPCRMIAPAYKKIAKEFKGDAVFLKVDVNRNYEASAACHVRGMPTFQFYYNKKQVSKFSGADERSLRSYTKSIVQQSQNEGTYVGQMVSSDALRKFYEKHDPEKAKEASQLAEKYAFKTAQLMRVCNKKYSEVPELSPRQVKNDAPEQKQQKKQHDQRKDKNSLADFSFSDLEAEIQRRGGSVSSKPKVQTEEESEEDFPFESAEDIAKSGVHPVVIIGGGPAGLAAATYTARAGLRPVVVAPAFGGQLLGKGIDVENYPGVVGEHATGRGLVELMRLQARSFEARFVDSAVVGVHFEKRPFRIRVNASEVEISAQTVILACGAESRWLNVNGENEYRGKGVSACATCDGFLYRGKDVAVVGGGDHAMEDALHLARTSRKVTLIHRRDRFRASKILAERVLASSIEIRWNTTVESFHGGSEDLTHIMLQSGAGSSQKLTVSAGFVAIGHDPQTRFLKDQVELDATGYVVLRKGTETSVPGVFAAGDISDFTYRQAATASGTGVMAALDAEKFLNEH